MSAREETPEPDMAFIENQRTKYRWRDHIGDVLDALVDFFIK